MIGSVVSHYTVLERLGVGGMGVVYKAEDIRLKRPVALKFLSPELTRDPEAKQRFVQEAQAASALDHPHVCTIHEIDETPDGQVFICMTYYGGETLRQRIQSGPLPVADALVIAIQIAEGLATTHEHGIVHRDIKPANIMLTADGTVKIVDFGLATLARRARLSRSGTVAGTLPYMAPEQARGDIVDARTDIWATGAVLYEMLTGRAPFGGDDDTPVLTAIQHEAVTPISRVRDDVPQSVAGIVARCLEKNPKARFASARELADELRRVRRAVRLSTASTVTGAPASATRSRWRRAALPAGLAALGAALLLAVVIRTGLPARGRHLLGGPTLPAKAHLAVLPFLNVGGDPANQAFIDGFVETLASRLTQLKGAGDLWVVPQSEVRARRVSSPSEARRAFGVTLVVTGAVKRSADEIEVALNLVDPEQPRQLRSWVIDEPQSRLNRVDERVLAALEDGLGMSAGGASTAAAERPTPAPEAYDLVMRGLGTLYSSRGPGDPRAAADLFKRAIGLDPRFALAHAGLAQAYLGMFRDTRNTDWVTASEASCARATALDASLAQVQVTLGAVKAATGHAEEAARAFRRALELEPANTDAVLGLAQAYQALGRTTDAETTFARAASEQPNDWLPYHRLGNFYVAQQRWKEAEAQYDKAAALAPENYIGPLDQGVAYFGQGRLPEARAAFRRSIALEPTYRGWSNLATVTFAEGRWREAADAYEKALAIMDEDYLVWGNLGSAYRQLPGEEARQRNALRKAIALGERRHAVDPTDPAITADLASYHAMLGETAPADRYLDEIRAAAAGDAALAFRVGETYEDMGRREAALHWIARALELGHPGTELMHAPGLASLRADPRFARMAPPAAPAGTPKSGEDR